mgnify:CR=1 FL=1
MATVTFLGACGSVTGNQRLAQLFQLALVLLQFAEQGSLVGDADVAPHLGMAGGNAGEVAEAAGGETEEFLAVLALRQVMHEGEGQQVRQVAHRGKHLIVARRRHLVPRCAAGRPGGAHPRARGQHGVRDRHH